MRDSKSPSTLQMDNLSLVIELDFLQKDPSIDGKRALCLRSQLSEAQVKEKSYDQRGLIE